MSAPGTFRPPPRYEPIACLGRGGGGEVWSVRDRISGDVVALKVLAEGSTEEEMLALVREAVALSGLEGLGAPRMLRFGRLDEGGRAYLVRDLVEGDSLSELAAQPGRAERAVAAVAEAADRATSLHRAELLHGDIKPANVIVGPSGVRLVDLGLASKWAALPSGSPSNGSTGGARALGMTPRYAAPELLAGGPLTIRAEVFALGRTLREVVEKALALAEPKKKALLEVAAKATSASPEDRYPSADELAIAIRNAAGFVFAERALAPAPTPWPIVAIDDATEALASAIVNLAPSRGLVVAGPPKSGRSTLLRRVAWSLGVRDERVAHVEAKGLADPIAALEIELAPHAGAGSVLLLVDDFDRLPAEAAARVDAARERGARIAIVTSGEAVPDITGPTLGVFPMPRLSAEVSVDLVRRAIPSLGDAVVAHVVTLADRWPGRLRAIVDLLAGRPVVATEDVDRMIAERRATDGESVPAPSLFANGAANGASADRLEAIKHALDRGHTDEAAELLAPLAGERSLELAIARSRLATSRGDPRGAIEALAPYEEEASRAVGIAPAEWALHASRAHLRAGDYAKAEEHGAAVRARLGALAGTREAAALESEGASLVGLAHAFAGRFDEAVEQLRTSAELAERSGSARVWSVALGSLGFVLQKFDRLADARTAYEGALAQAELAGDAGSVATTRLNLATIARTQGDIGATLVHLEAAVDMGKRSGRLSTLRHALVNLANLDLYLGRIAKAEGSIAELARERDALPKQLAAHLFALEAEAAERRGEARLAYELCGRTADAYEAFGHGADAAEALLWGVLFAVSAEATSSRDGAAVPAERLASDVARAREMLVGQGRHQSLLEIAAGEVALLEGEEASAARAFDRAIAAASEDKLRDLRVRALDRRADIARRLGDDASARRLREEAVAVLGAIAAELPADLVEVFWSDPRRRALRHPEVVAPETYEPPASTDPPAREPVALPDRELDRFARVLEINREIAGTYDLPRLLERVTDHAIALAGAERGFVLLRSQRRAAEGALSVHASRGEGQGEGDAHGRFSQSIADRVIAGGEPIVTSSAQKDARMSDYVSVHQLMLESIACVPIRSRTSGVIGALYLETRLRAGRRFEAELPILIALADQVAIAIETARLVSENEKRAGELERANQELAAARSKLEELLDHRTAQLSATRKDLRSARAVLKGHFGYEGLVGTSDAMRRLYALIDRVKDTDVPVLITGESGTGKEMVARAIHNAGPRGKKTFVGINCGAIPEHLLESELFGHVRGAFTGAERDRRGLFREATDGTILLDEIGEMPPKMQAGLLRVLQEKVVRPVGSAKEEPVDTRVIAATHRDLQAMVGSGGFREDLFYRLNVIPVLVPPLRDRIEDIPVLIDHFLGIFAARYNRERRSVSRGALKMLMAHRWPGNVRQLENVLLNAWVLSDAPELEVEDFGMFEASKAAPANPERPPKSSGGRGAAALPTSLEQHKNHEKDRILAALASANWNRVKAAELIGMPRRTFYRRLKEYGIQ